VHAGRQKLKLDEETRWQVAGEAIDELGRYGGWKARSMRKLQSPIRTRQTTSANAESSKQKPE